MFAPTTQPTPLGIGSIKSTLISLEQSVYDYSIFCDRLKTATTTAEDNYDEMHTEIIESENKIEETIMLLEDAIQRQIKQANSGASNSVLALSQAQSNSDKLSNIKSDYQAYKRRISEQWERIELFSGRTRYLKKYKYNI